MNTQHDVVHAPREWKTRSIGELMAQEEQKQELHWRLENIYGHDLIYTRHTLEDEYRRGYMDGWILCAQAIEAIYHKGYSRAIEISNILEEFWFQELQEWRNAKRGGYLEGPRPSIEPWRTIRERVLRRDGHQCAQCGASQDLQVDHVTPVAMGGLPVEDNLRILCRTCNQKRRRT